MSRSDFSRCKDHDSYQKAFGRLLRDLKADASDKSARQRQNIPAIGPQLAGIPLLKNWSGRLRRMDDATLTRILNALAARCVSLENAKSQPYGESQTKIALLDDARFEAMLAKVVDAYKEFLDPQKAASERLAESLRKFEGPIQ